jgi:hypothetical protein
MSGLARGSAPTTMVKAAARPERKISSSVAFTQSPAPTSHATLAFPMRLYPGSQAHELAPDPAAEEEVEQIAQDVTPAASAYVLAAHGAHGTMPLTDQVPAVQGPTMAQTRSPAKSQGEAW